MAAGNAGAKTARHGEVADNNHEIVQAYAKLDFGSKFAYYIQTLDVVIGRQAGTACGGTAGHLGEAQSSRAVQSTIHCTSTPVIDAASEPSPAPLDSKRVDIDLGRLKSISRQHARLAYDTTTEIWQLHVLGKNGVLVGDRFYGKGEVAPLQDEISIQICEITFTFRLPAAEETPRQDAMKTSPLDQTGEASSTQAHHNGLVASSSVTVEITPEDPVPVASKTNRPPKPPLSYTTLIYQALNTAPSGRASHSYICKAIARAHEYYSLKRKAWQNSLAQVLSSQDCFRQVDGNVAKDSEEWEVHPSHHEDFKNNVYRRRRNLQVRDNNNGQVKLEQSDLQPQSKVLSEDRRALDSSKRLQEGRPSPPSVQPTVEDLPGLSPTGLISDPLSSSTNASVKLEQSNTSINHQADSNNASRLLSTSSIASSEQKQTSSDQAQSIRRKGVKLSPIPIHPTFNSSTDTFELGSVLNGYSNESIDILIAQHAKRHKVANNPSVAPVVRYGATLLLDPLIFAHLSLEQLRHLRRLGATQALQILQEYYEVQKKGALKQSTLAIKEIGARSTRNSSVDSLNTGSDNMKSPGEDAGSGSLSPARPTRDGMHETKTALQGKSDISGVPPVKSEAKASLQSSLLALAKLPASRLPKGVTPAALQALLKMNGLANAAVDGAPVVTSTTSPKLSKESRPMADV